MPPRKTRKAASKAQDPVPAEEQTQQEPAAAAAQEPKTTSQPILAIQHSELETEEVFETLASALVSDIAKKTTEQEKKLNVLLGGYMNRQRILANKFAEANAAYEQSVGQRYIFEGKEMVDAEVMDED